MNLKSLWQIYAPEFSDWGRCGRLLLLSFVLAWLWVLLIQQSAIAR